MFLEVLFVGGNVLGSIVGWRRCLRKATYPSRGWGEWDISNHVIYCVQISVTTVSLIDYVCLQYFSRDIYNFSCVYKHTLKIQRVTKSASGNSRQCANEVD